MPIDYSEFEKQSASAWQSAAEKALKGKPLEGLMYDVDKVISTAPYYTAEQVQSVLQSRSSYKQDNRWYIGETFNGESPSTANEELLKALAFGLDSPLLFDVTDFDTCLEEVSLDFLFPVFRGCNLESYLDYLKQHNLDLHALKGAFLVYEAGYGDISIAESKEEISLVADQLPQHYHSLLNISIDAQNIGRSMGRHLYQLSDMIYQLKEIEVQPRIVCEIECDADFLKNIGTIRALRIQIDKICEVYEIEPNSVILDAYAYETAQDAQLAMIGASTKAVSAVSAGVDRLTVSCEALDVQLDEEANRRMARNVHHLMMMESGLDEVYDPLAGSYSIETLTSKIAEQSWKVFQEQHK